MVGPFGRRRRMGRKVKVRTKGAYEFSTEDRTGNPGREALEKGRIRIRGLEGADKISKTSGKPMIELRLKLTDGKASRTLIDYLLAETPEKLRHAASACSLLDRYETGDLPGAEFKGKKGKLRLGIEKDKKKEYPDKNVVLDYICAETIKAAPRASGAYGLNFSS